MPLFEARLEKNGGHQKTYLTEVRGPLTRVPQQHKSFLRHPFPMPWMDEANKTHHLSLAAIRGLQDKGLEPSEKYRPSVASTKKSGRSHLNRKLKKAYKGIFSTYKMVVA